MKVSLPYHRFSHLDTVSLRKMESGHLDTGIALEESDFDNLTFPLVSDGSVTTDGSLLSGITTDAIRDDLAQHLSSEHEVQAVSNNIAGNHDKLLL